MTYKTAKIPYITSRAVDIIIIAFFIHALDVIEGIFAVLYVSYRGLQAKTIHVTFHLISNKGFQSAKVGSSVN